MKRECCSCHRPIDGRATVCPYCGAGQFGATGRKPSLNRLLKTLLILVPVLALATGTALYLLRPELFGGRPKTPAAQETAVSQSEAETPAPALTPDEQVAKGQELYAAGSYEDAFELFSTAYKAKASGAAGWLGLCWETGNGTKQDSKKAVQFYKEAFEAGDPVASARLGHCYAVGNGTVQDIDTALTLFEQGAEQGVPLAKYYLGACYEQATGVEKNYRQAAYWIEKAAEGNLLEAESRMYIYCRGGIGVSKDPDAARTWLEKASKDDERKVRG